MRRFLLAAAFVTLTVLVGTGWAQAPQQPDGATSESRERLRQLASDPVVQAQIELMRALVARQQAERAQQESRTCAGPGNAPVALNAEIFFDGRAYRCVEVFGPNEAPGMANAPLKQRTVGLVLVGAAAVKGG